MIYIPTLISEITAISMLLYIIIDRYIRERRREESLQKAEIEKRELAKKRYEDLQKRVYNLEIGIGALLEKELGQRDSDEIKKEIINLLYKNPGWISGDYLEKVLFKCGWEAYSRCRNLK